MVKNITLSLPDNLYNEMKEFQEVNWSGLARKCIEDYIRLRSEPELAPILEQLSREKNEEWAKGKALAYEVVKEESYSSIAIAVERYRKLVDELAIMGAYPSEYEKNFDKFLDDIGLGRENKNFPDFGVWIELAPSLAKASKEFVRGFRETIITIYEKLLGEKQK